MPDQPEESENPRTKIRILISEVEFQGKIDAKVTAAVHDLVESIKAAFRS